MTEPIPMRLPCPECGELHIDEGEFSTKPHHTHACQSCGAVWRPAIVHTVGVRFLPGFKGEPAPSFPVVRCAATEAGQRCEHLAGHTGQHEAISGLGELRWDVNGYGPRYHPDETTARQPIEVVIRGPAKVGKSTMAWQIASLLRHVGHRTEFKGEEPATPAGAIDGRLIHVLIEQAPRPDATKRAQFVTANARGTGDGKTLPVGCPLVGSRWDEVHITCTQREIAVIAGSAWMRNLRCRGTRPDGPIIRWTTVPHESGEPIRLEGADDHKLDGLGRAVVGLVRTGPPKCERCQDTGVIETGNNDLPCVSCPAGKAAKFNVAGRGTVSGADILAERGGS